MLEREKSHKDIIDSYESNKMDMINQNNKIKYD